MYAMMLTHSHHRIPPTVLLMPPHCIEHPPLSSRCLATYNMVSPSVLNTLNSTHGILPMNSGCLPTCSENLALYSEKPPHWTEHPHCITHTLTELRIGFVPLTAPQGNNYFPSLSCFASFGRCVASAAQR